MSTFTEEAKVRIITDTDLAEKSLRELKKELKNLQTAMTDLKQGSKEFDNAGKNAAKLQQNIADLSVTIRKLPKNSVAELEQEVRKLTSEWRRASVGTEEFVNKSKRLKDVKQQLADLKAETANTGSAMSNLLGSAKNVFLGTFASNAATAGLQNMAGFFKDGLDYAAKLSDEIADIQKTTGMSAVEAKNLVSELNKINTRTSAEDLRKIAIAAGQLGIAKQDILKFTETIDKLNVALGDEFSSSEEVTKTIGTLRNVLGDIKTDAVDKDLLHIGNALNELGAAGLATGPVVADFANRIGGVGSSLGLTSGQILGLSATLQELNVSTERGGTAVSRILQKMTTDTKSFYEVAKGAMDPKANSFKDFTDLVNNDLYGAFKKFIEGSTKGGQSATALAGILKDTELQGAGASEVILKLRNGMDLLDDKTKLASKALTETGSVMKEFGLKNENTAATLERAGKSLSKYFSDNSLTRGFTSLAVSIAEVIAPAEKLSAVTRQEQVDLVGLRSKLLNANLTTKERVDLVKELQAKYPAYLGNLDAETASNSDLAIALGKVNSNLTQKLLLSKQDEKLSEKAKDFTDVQTELNDTMAETEDYLNSVAQQYNIIELKGSTTTQKFRSLIEQMKKLGGAAADDVGRQTAFINNNYFRVINNLQKDANEKQQAYFDQTKKRADAIKRLNLNPIDDKVSNKPAAAGGTTKTTAVTLPGVASDEELKRAVKDRKDFVDNIKKIDDTFYKVLLENTKDEQTKELIQYNKHAEDMANEMHAAGFSKEKINEQYKMGLDAINKKYAAQDLKEAQDLAKKKADTEDKLYGAQQTNAQNQITALDDKYEKLYNDALAAGIKDIDLEKLKQIEIEKILDAEVQAKLDAEKKVVDEKDKIRKEELTKERETRAAQIKVAEQYAQNTLAIYQSINTIRNNRDAADLQDAEAKAEQEKAILKSKLDKKLITEVEYNKRQAKIDADLDKKKRQAAYDQAKRDKAAAVFGAVINMASAIAQINANPAVNADISQTLRGILTALVSTAGIAQIAAITSQPLPKLSKGAEFGKRGGVANFGQYHSNHGIMLTDGASGQPLAEMERDETIMVLSREATRNNRMLIDSLLQSSMAGGGKPVLPALRYGAMMDLSHHAMPKMAVGGVLPTPPPNQSITTSIANETNMALLQAINTMNILMQQLITNGIQATAILDTDAVKDITTVQQKISNVENRSRG